ncbi:DNA gyrase subunit A [Mycoplasma sp. ATU-Cv-508]|uniref:DNA gyrase subunit A n=1 Tax=Mycoplasma sp. ATU-Cv-508 TaxID=2048001 RepID=UPI000FDEF7FB
MFNNFDDDDKKYQGEDEKIATIFGEEPKADLDSSDPTEQNELASPKSEPEISSQIISDDIDGLSPVGISKEMRQSFLEYAMSVIVARALPDARDGLKPVHRRILYGLHELGLLPNVAYKKSARIVGDVLGKYHPHGDSPVYEAMVRMAQDFSMRYQLVDGHGNFGSIDGDPAAAMRYTEARMSKHAALMLDGIRKETVNFVDNYDSSEKEPAVLPARFPNLLANGATGIAVGMATNIPPHNLSETIEALIMLAQNPAVTTEQLMQVLPAPDFPTGGLITGVSGLRHAYQSGRGSVCIRSKTEIETLKNGKHRIIVTEIPYLVNKAHLVEKIAELVKNKALDGITDLRDETSRHGMRIVIELRRDVVPEVVRNHLFKMTNLQTNFSINMLALVGGQPKTLGLKEMLSVYLAHQVEVLTRRTTYDLNKAQTRAHVLQGLKVAVENIDAVIQIIKKAQHDQAAQNALQTRFNLSPEQTKAIIDMRLGRLTSLATEKMREELADLEKQITELKAILADKNLLIQTIISELREIQTKYSDVRRSEIVEGLIAIDDEDLIPQKDIAITMSAKGYVKRVPLEQFQIQRRGGVGARSMSTYEDDQVDSILTTSTHTDLLIFTSVGKVYRIRAHQIPESSKQAKGTPFVNVIPDLDKNEKVVSLLSLSEYKPEHYLLTATEQGVVKRTLLSEYARINRNGKRALGLREDDVLVRALIVKEGDQIVLGSSGGRVARFGVEQIRPMGRSAAGVRGIKLNLSAGEKLVGLSYSRHAEDKLLAIGEQGFGKLTPIDQYRQTNRGAKGVISLNTKKAGQLRFVRIVKGYEDLLVTTKKGITIRTALEQVSVSGRATKGVKLLRSERITPSNLCQSLTAPKLSKKLRKQFVKRKKSNLLKLRH